MPSKKGKYAITNTIKSTGFIRDEEMKKEHSEIRNIGTGKDENYVFNQNKRNDMVIKVNVYKIPFKGGISGRL